METALLIAGVALVSAVCAVWWLTRRRRRRWCDVRDSEGGSHRIPLPPHSVPARDAGNSHAYLTTATAAMLGDYLHRTLRDAGWAFQEVLRESTGRMLAVLARGHRRLHIRVDSRFLETGHFSDRLTFSVIANVAPSALEQELAAIEEQAVEGNSGAVVPLVARLADARPRIRRAAISALTVIKDQTAVQPLIAALNDDDEEARRFAARALGTLGGKEGVDGLIRGVSSGGDGDFRATCAWSLGRIGDRRASSALLPLLQQPYWRLQCHAAIALGALGDRASVDALTTCMKEPGNDPKVRGAALCALKDLMSEVEFGALVRELTLVRSGPPSQGERWKDASAAGIAELATDMIFDALGLEH